MTKHINSHKNRGKLYRFVVVNSTALEDQRINTLDKKLAKEKDNLINKANKLSKNLLPVKKIQQGRFFRIQKN